MVKTKGVAATVAAWQGAIGSVPAKYKAGVQAANNTIENAIAAQPLYEARMAESIANKSRVKGLQKTSTGEWKARASELGRARIGVGISAALPKYNKWVTEVIQTIEATSIGERTADPMANVDNRVKPLVKELYDMKRR
ncbi:MAG: hypothetical protein Q8N60_00350 [Candidatus Diapherotrites archaeon]|nr:hypothetical protein [Candidatus Diapherotrites archaeon]